jgi:NDP-sugar pyrophosphorylase family protein
MSYRVCIPVAGTGSRLGDLTRFVNKSLVSIANRPVLSHLIEQFPDDAEFVIALGHKGHLVREFLALAYPQRRFLFVEVDPFEGDGSGLGLTLLACKQYLQQAFVFISCDTLVREFIPTPSTNWMAYSEGQGLAPYRTLEVVSGRVKSIAEKGEGKTGSHSPYIGLAGIADYRAFWVAMEEGGAVAVAAGEAHGMNALLEQDVHAHSFTWYDTGNPEALVCARDAYKEPASPNILEKANEAIWFVGDSVIKFSDDKQFIAHRVQRASALGGFVPEVSAAQTHMYRYGKVEGRVLSEVACAPLFGRLLEHARKFWQPQILTEAEMEIFHATCMRFYRDKTVERINLFYTVCARVDGTEMINRVPMPTLAVLLDRLDWEWLADGLPGRFHGDFHFENILWSDARQDFTFLDWRQDFGGALHRGDIYYDLAKLLHGLIISHELIAREHFTISWGKDEIRYDFHRKQALVECESMFYQWLLTQGYDCKKTRVLTALIYLNIAALHHHPYSLLLFALGKKMLNEEVGA